MFERPDAAEAHPFWADGGDGYATGPGGFAPGRHLLAALPDRLDRVRVEALPFRGLLPWLRERLPPTGGDGAVYAVLLAYDAGRNLERTPATAREDPPLPDVIVARYPAWLESPGPEGPWTLRGVTDEARRHLQAWLSGVKPTHFTLSDRPATGGDAGPTASEGLPEALESTMSPAAHRVALEDVLEGIAAGDLYQANVARRLEAPMDPALTPALYRRLRRATPPAFGALWALDRETWLASASPECLLTWDPAQREAHSYPIKGTRPRGTTREEDEALGRELRADPKERAEHVMIVDLVRNDLGRVAVPGGVHVADLFGLQTLSTVHHLVSDVVADVRPDADLVDLLGALFPGGSITGAPKIAAMARIERVEGLRRGFYTGSLGVVGPDGGASFNILIRTCVAAGGRLLYQTGGGIVADSDPATEWEETEVKAAALVRALRGRPRA
ncbi:MAG: anthranilate synthase component I family protein [Myxococcota bacterium]